ncbi:MAG TPA: hypothetical protein VFB82_05425, partial [Blastocatellia bacterium]|nr:hypothetical protein [Blastocatellia bacterium]
MRLSRKFKPPKKSDIQSWTVVEFVVKAGFFYESIYVNEGQLARYPKTMKDAQEFVCDYAERIKQSV